MVVGWTGNMFNIFKRYGVLKNLIKDIDWIDFKVQDRTKFIPHNEMPNYYHSIDVIVCLSDAEGTPNPILEASACGRTWISTNVGIVELLNNVSDEIKPGIIIDNHNDLISNLRFLYENKNIMKKMGFNARKSVVENFSWDRQIVQFKNVFDLLQVKN